MYAKNIVLPVMGALAVLAGCQPAGVGPGATAATPCPCNSKVASATKAELIQVANVSEVCMINNEYKASKQIPVVVDGKTYYGCCENCVATLTKDPSSRSAQDPVSGATVDKAVAVIGREPGGKVHYFASVENLAKYRSTPAM